MLVTDEKHEFGQPTRITITGPPKLTIPSIGEFLNISSTSDTITKLDFQTTDLDNKCIYSEIKSGNWLRD
jgi:hypothetical protein